MEKISPKEKKKQWEGKQNEQKQKERQEIAVKNVRKFPWYYYRFLA